MTPSRIDPEALLAWDLHLGALVLGPDKIGRDSYSRIVHGARTALLVGTDLRWGSVLGIGPARTGCSPGYLGRLQAMRSMMRVMDALYAYPSLLLALVVLDRARAIPGSTASMQW